MNVYIKTLLFVLLLSLSACQKDDNASSGIYTLNSNINPLKGFLFESLSIISYPNSSNVKPEFTVLPQMNDTGKLVSPFLGQIDLESRFALLRQFDDFKSAQLYFDSLKVVESKTLEQFANNIKPNQVWQIKMNDGGFGKLLIVEARVDVIENNTAFAEIKFKAEKMK